MDQLPELSTGVIALLVFLLPGFLASWVFFGLTSHPRPERFERVIQALIFTFLVQALVPAMKWLLLGIGLLMPLLPWTGESQLVSSLVLAVFVGALLTVCANKDIPHKWLRENYSLTLRTAYPSEWFCAFSALKKPVILNLKDGRRLQGWPKEWPVDASRGQFLLEDPAWIDEDGEYVELPQIDSLLFPVDRVEWVEFMREEYEHVESDAQQDRR